MLIAILLVAVGAVAELSPFKLASIELAWASDVYLDDIDNVTIYQWSGAAWGWKATLVSANWSGASIRVDDGKALQFNLTMHLNGTLASSAAEADTYTYVNMTITSTEPYSLSVNMTNYYQQGIGSPTMYYLKEYYTWNVTSYPKPASTYTVKHTYRAYY